MKTKTIALLILALALAACGRSEPDEITPTDSPTSTISATVAEPDPTISPTPQPTHTPLPPETTPEIISTVIPESPTPTVQASLKLAAIRNEDLDPYEIQTTLLGSTDDRYVPLRDPLDRTSELDICLQDCVKYVWNVINGTFTLIMLEHETAEGARNTLRNYLLIFESSDFSYVNMPDEYEAGEDSKWMGMFHSVDHELHHKFNYVLASATNHVTILLIYRSQFTGFFPDLDSLGMFWMLENFERFQIEKLQEFGY